MYDVIIIGAGAAGMMAAGTAAQNGKKVLVIEKMEKAGRKIRITGKGRCNLTNARPPEEFAEQVRTNADTPRDAAQGRAFGAQGIGLCRTEHMFFEGERIKAMREMIVADNTEDRKKALAKIMPYQQGDFEGLYEAMEGCPVVIRFLDPPLHEFLPTKEEDIKEIAGEMGGTMPCVLNAANEVAVDAFLHDRLGFNDIARVVDACMNAHERLDVVSFEQIADVDAWTRRRAAQAIAALA